jgi:hypothetical protein
MSLGTRWLALCLGLTLVLSAVAADSKTDKGKKETADKEKLRPLTGSLGVLVKVHRVDIGSKTLHIELNRQNIDVVASDDMKVRSDNEPTFFDEKGNIKKATGADLAKAKGDTKLPGAYTADFEDVKAGMVVRMWLAQKADSPTLSPKKKDKGKDKDASQPDQRIRVTHIVIPRGAKP